MCLRMVWEIEDLCLLLTAALFHFQTVNQGKKINKKKNHENDERDEFLSDFKHFSAIFRASVVDGPTGGRTAGLKDVRTEPLKEKRWHT